jgi:hypothetical protein
MSEVSPRVEKDPRRLLGERPVRVIMYPVDPITTEWDLRWWISAFASDGLKLHELGVAIDLGPGAMPRALVTRRRKPARKAVSR